MSFHEIDAPPFYRVAIHMEIWEKSGGNIFDEKALEIHEKLSK